MGNPTGKGGFNKGKSGNPGGRPKEVGEVKELARQHTVEAIETLVDIMKHGDRDASRVSAAEAILDRGWGKPSQAIEHDGNLALIHGYIDVPRRENKDEWLARKEKEKSQQ